MFLSCLQKPRNDDDDDGQAMVRRKMIWVIRVEGKGNKPFKFQAASHFPSQSQSLSLYILFCFVLFRLVSYSTLVGVAERFWLASNRSQFLTKELWSKVKFQENLAIERVQEMTC